MDELISPAPSQEMWGTPRCQRDGRCPGAGCQRSLGTRSPRGAALLPQDTRCPSYSSKGPPGPSLAAR